MIHAHAEVAKNSKYVAEEKAKADKAIFYRRGAENRRGKREEFFDIQFKRANVTTWGL